ncbi:FG-GAP-like repeat-containing protein [Streptomyces sp. CAU 1734]|uniref:FG-GAP-like repeat-containing protein n=1 Tax=Streptomyces sp. CAU 1734 TaxID=3140360 RepID=UPI003260CF5D
MNSLTPARALTLAAAITAVGALVTPTALAAPAPAAPSAHSGKAVLPDDFNGDGYRDVAVGSEYLRVKGRVSAGHVSVLYGSKAGSLHTRRQLLDQSRPGVPDDPEPFDNFGASTAAADLDGDGYGDLVVGTPGEEAPGANAYLDTGSLSVFRGGKTGLNTSATVLQGGGKHLVTGDFNGDRHPDVATVGYLKEQRAGELILHSGPFTRDGSPAATTVTPLGNEYVHDIATGDYNGDAIPDLVVLQNAPVWSSIATRIFKGTRQGPVDEGMLKKVPGGQSVGLGDINNDGYDEIVVGRRGYLGDDYRPKNVGGMIAVVPGSAKGPVAAKAKVIDQNSPGVPGAAESGDSFGGDIALGDIDKDGYEDLAVAVPDEAIGKKRHAGAVVVLRGSKGGVSAAGGAVFSQDAAGVPGTAETYDGFATAIKLVDHNRDHRADLVIGVPHEDGYTGAVLSLKGSPSGITAKGAYSFGPRTLGLTPSYGDNFGSGFNH